MDYSINKETEKLAIVGAGSIGIGWAIVFAKAGYSVSLFDVDQNQVASTPARIDERLALLDRHQLLQEDVAVISARVSATASLKEALSQVSYVQECGPEKVEFKRDLFQELESYLPEKAIIASSSSAITPSRFTAEMKHPERALVVHPGNPPYLLAIAEVVPSAKTSEPVILESVKLLESAGMSAVVVRNEPEGFVFNRLQGAILREAYALVRDGVISARELDDIMIKGLGKRWSLIGAFGTSALNVKGGIKAHAERMGESYWRMGQERGANDPWNSELVEKVADDISLRFPDELWEKKVLQRDLGLMKLTQLFQENEELNF
jgi:L-gulonate 3-dehydrogenase